MTGLDSRSSPSPLPTGLSLRPCASTCLRSSPWAPRSGLSSSLPSRRAGLRPRQGRQNSHPCAFKVLSFARVAPCCPRRAAPRASLTLLQKRRAFSPCDSPSLCVASQCSSSPAAAALITSPRGCCGASLCVLLRLRGRGSLFLADQGSAGFGRGGAISSAASAVGCAAARGRVGNPPRPTGKQQAQAAACARPPSCSSHPRLSLGPLATLTGSWESCRRRMLVVRAVGSSRAHLAREPQPFREMR